MVWKVGIAEEPILELPELHAVHRSASGRRNDNLAMGGLCKGGGKEARRQGIWEVKEMEEVEEAKERREEFTTEVAEGHRGSGEFGGKTQGAGK